MKGKNFAKATIVAGLVAGGSLAFLSPYDGNASSYTCKQSMAYCSGVLTYACKPTPSPELCSRAYCLINCKL
jgi:hypothetical protein